MNEPGQSQEAGETAPTGGPLPRRSRAGPRPVFGRAVTYTFGFAFLLIAASAIGGAFAFQRVVYLTLLFAIGIGPFLMGRTNARHRLLAVFMGCYLLIFGISDGVGILLGTPQKALFGDTGEFDLGSIGILTKSDLVVLLGALAFVLAYFGSQRFTGSRQSGFLAREWRYSTVLKAGVTLWLIGFAFILSYDMVVSPINIPESVLGLPLGIASNLRLLSPLGGVMLVYLLARGYRPGTVVPLLIAIISAEFILGFFANSKEISFRIAVLTLLGLYFVRGRFSWKILSVMIAVAIPYLLFFNAYRLLVMEQRFQDQASAFEERDKNLEAVQKRVSLVQDVVGSSLTSLRQRIDGKVYVDVIVNGVDSGKVATLDGESLGWFFSGFIPRAVWPEKPDASLGQRFNIAFGLSASRFTFVPTTQLGDLYWNFGLIGALLGMATMGLIFGKLGVVLDAARLTLPRFMVLLVATYYLAIRFEGNVALQYTIFVRLVLVIWLADLIMRQLGVTRSRPTGSARREAERTPETARSSAPGPTGIAQRPGPGRTAA